MRRAPAGIAAIDFSGSGEPREKGLTESWNVPRVALPVQPGGATAAAGAVANNAAIRVRTTYSQTPQSRQKSMMSDDSPFAHRVDTALPPRYKYHFPPDVPILFRQDPRPGDPKQILSLRGACVAPGGLATVASR